MQLKNKYIVLKFYVHYTSSFKTIYIECMDFRNGMVIFMSFTHDSKRKSVKR